MGPNGMGLDDSRRPRLDTFLTLSGRTLISGSQGLEDLLLMTDFMYLAALVGFFIASGLYVRFCEKL